MQRKLRRSRSPFRRRQVPGFIKVLGSIILCVAMVAAGFFGAKHFSEQKQGKPATVLNDSDVDAPANKPGNGGTHKPDTDPNDTTPSDTPTNDTKPDDKPDAPVEAPDFSDSIRAFYLPVSALSVDSLTDSATLQEAKAAGFNAVVFDLKDADGNLYYHFTNPQAKKVGYASNALTADNLKALFALIRDAGLQPIPRLYAFRDNAACAVLSDARISLVGNHSWSWYDGNKDKGGKKWLNPYSAASQSYVQALAKELKDAGAAAIMLDGVQFPNKLDKNAYLGEEAATVSKSDVLTAFVDATRTALGADCPLLLGCTAEGALATDTKIYDGNPLTFGSTIASPLLTSKIKESVEKMVLRLQGPDAQGTVLAPMLQVDSVAQANEALTACVTAGANSFILVLPEGNYDFSAYSLP